MRLSCVGQLFPNERITQVSLYGFRLREKLSEERLCLRTGHVEFGSNTTFPQVH